MSDKIDLRDSIRRRWTVLKTERQPYVAQWLALSEQVAPSSGRFLEDGSIRNLARERWNRIYDNTPIYCATTLAAGLQSGMNDPATQWFSLTTGTPFLDESHEVKIYLDQVQRLLSMAFDRTNTYQALHHIWREVSIYGTAAMVICEDPLTGFHCYPLVCGEYCVGADYRGVPDTLYRSFSMTAAQMIQRYGRSKVSQAVLNAYDYGNKDEYFKCLHAIEPRNDRDPTKKDNKNMPWRSVVLQLDVDDNASGILEESGHNEFPAVVGRWAASASDIYSEECPGMVALGDILQLQHECLQKGNAIDYLVNPARILPTSARHSEIDFQPGGISFIDMPNIGSQANGANAFKLDISSLEMDMAETRQRIRQAFFVDMFMMISSSNKHQMTAEEVVRRNEEKLMLLNPVLSRLNNEVLEKLIERAFAILQRAGALPPPPKELEGGILQVRYMSMLSRAQRSMRANNLDQFLGRVANVAQFRPEVLNKVDPLVLIDEYADCLGVPPSTVVPNEQVQKIIQAQQEQQQQQQEQMQMQQGLEQGADVISKLGKVPADDSTMGGKMLKTLGAAGVAHG